MQLCNTARRVHRDRVMGLHVDTHAGLRAPRNGMEALSERERRERRQAWVYFGVLAIAIIIVIAAMIYALFG
jgi:hypothetical protein